MRAENNSLTGSAVPRSDPDAFSSAALGVAFAGRREECRRLREAIENRKSLLIWGPADSGKTAMLQDVIRSPSASERRRCVYWGGPATVKQLAGRLLFRVCAPDELISLAAARRSAAPPHPSEAWLNKYSSGRLKLLLFDKIRSGRFCFFLDHMPAPTQPMARLLKEIIWRGRTPVFFVARGNGLAEIGAAWSIYYVPQYQLRLGPLGDSAARTLLESCICRFGLDALDLSGFREEMLHLSAGLPGALVKMCELAAKPRYHYGDRIKLKLVHVDYLMRTAESGAARRGAD